MGLDVDLQHGLVSIGDWIGEELIVNHLITPAKARILAANLLIYADKAEQSMPKFPEDNNGPR